MGTEERPREGKEKPELPPEPAVEVPEAVRERVRVEASPVRCPFCHDDVKVGEQRWVACAGCLARHHAGCWSEAKRCAACGDAACLAGGRSRGRGVVFGVSAVMILFLLGLRSIVQSEFAEFRRDLREITAEADKREAAPAPAPVAAAVPGPYLGETAAVAALRIAAHGGDAAAAHDLAAALAEGKGVAPNPVEALRWFERSADGGDARAMRALAESHATGAMQPDGKTNAAQTIFWYRRAVEVAYDRATAKKLIVALGFSAEALTWIERLVAEEEDPELMIRAHLVTEQLHGHVKAAEAGWVVRAIVLLSRRADGGDQAAAKALIELLESGRFSLDLGGAYTTFAVTEQRYEDILPHFERWAAAGRPWAMQRLEEAYDRGEYDLPRDATRAHEWRRKLAESGDVFAMLRCGHLVDLDAPEGLGEAADWLRRALAHPEITSSSAYAARDQLQRVLQKRPDLRQPGDP